jgi:hypothetical protein
VLEEAEERLGLPAEHLVSEPDRELPEQQVEAGILQRDVPGRFQGDVPRGFEASSPRRLESVGEERSARAISLDLTMAQSSTALSAVFVGSCLNTANWGQRGQRSRVNEPTPSRRSSSMLLSWSGLVERYETRCFGSRVRA